MAVDHDAVLPRGGAPLSRAVPLVTLLACLALGAPTDGAESGGEGADPAGLDACLLTDEEVAAVQGREVVERLTAAKPNRAFEVLECVYRTPDLVSPVSLALGVPLAEPPGGARRYWMERFHPAGGMPESKVGVPQPVAGLGEEAFWMGDPRIGALFVLSGERFLRVSVGGEPDEARRRERTLRLAESAVARLP